MKELKDGYPFVYVWNREDEFGEFGSIQIKIEQGGLIRSHSIIIEMWASRLNGLGVFISDINREYV